MFRSASTCLAAGALVCLISVAALAQLDNSPPQAFVRGKVILADGQAPPEKVEILLVCAGQALPQGKTDAEGRFRFEWGAPRFLETATIPAWPPPVASTSDQRGYLKQMTCYLRSALKGYVSETVDLSRLPGTKRDDSVVITLHPIAGAPAKPDLSLVRQSAVEQKWQDVLDRSDAVLKLNPTEFPEAYYYRAVAHYNLEHLDQAFEDAQQAVKLDTAHTVPLAEQLLGVLFSMRGDHKSAAEQFRNYLQHVPPATNVTAVKALLAEAEQRAAPK
jgi:tetratricopeptide (TPR) repeat protein